MLIVIWIVLVGVLIVAVAGAWLLFHLQRQNRELEQRLTALEARRQERRSPSEVVRALRAQAGLGLPAGSVLNDFELPLLRGGTSALSRWRGSSLALIVVQPSCPFSRALVERLAGVAPPAAQILLISTGDPEEQHEAFPAAVDRWPLLLQDDLEVAQLLRARATPSAYLVDPTGVTASPLMPGATAILTALGESPSPYVGGGVGVGAPKPVDTTPIEARPPRLPPIPATGAPAPIAAIPVLGGDAISLTSRDRSTLVVLAHIDCPPSRAAVATLDERVRGGDAPFDVVLVAQGPPNHVAAFVADADLTLPVAVDDDRGIARAFGTLETPVAFLIDSAGVIADSPVAGAAAISLLIGVRDEARSTAPRRATRLKTRGSKLEAPLVSVVLTTRDRPGFLPIALRCFAHQRYPNRELIVVDDGDRFPVDTDAVEAVGGTLIRVAPNTPLGTKLNLGLEAARGSLCQKMDDDDWYAPNYTATMVETVTTSQPASCRPTVAFVTPFLFFDVGRWEIRRSVDRNVPGATLFFRRDDWRLRPFRALPGDEDLWFYRDQVRAGATWLPVERPELFLAVRHRGAARDRGHTWTNQWDNRTLEAYLLDRPLHERQAEAMLPSWALAFYRELRAELRAAAAPD